MIQDAEGILLAQHLMILKRQFLCALDSLSGVLETIGCDYACRDPFVCVNWNWLPIFTLHFSARFMNEAKKNRCFCFGGCMYTFLHCTHLRFVYYVFCILYFCIYNVLLIDRRTMLTIKNAWRILFSSCLYFPSFRRDAHRFFQSFCINRDRIITPPNSELIFLSLSI